MILFFSKKALICLGLFLDPFAELQGHKKSGMLVISKYPALFVLAMVLFHVENEQSMNIRRLASESEQG